MLILAVVIAGAVACGVAVGAPAADAASAAQAAVTSPAVPVPGATVDPNPTDPVPTDEPATGEPTPPAEPDSTSTPEPTEEPSVEPTPVPTASETPVAPTPVPTHTVVVRPQTPPALTDAGTPWQTIALAVLALILSAVVLFLLLRRRVEPAAQPAGWTPAPTTAPRTKKADRLALLVAMGSAMIDSGYPVTIVGRTLGEIARANRFESTSTLVFPTAIMVSLGDGESVTTRVVSVGESSFMLNQVDELDDVLTASRAGELTPAEAKSRIERIRTLPAPYPPLLQLAAYVVVSAGLSVLLGASWAGVGLAALLGGAVGGMLQLGSRLPRNYQVLLTVGASFGVSVVVFLLVRASLDPGVFPSLVAPLVILLPGALLTTSVIELSTGQFMSGSARLAAGAMRLVLLAIGIVAAAALVGIPALTISLDSEPLGPLAPWIGVGLFGVGIAVHQCARPSAIGWIVVVLYVAYGAQVLGDLLFGGVLSAFIGALVMTPVAVLIARHPRGPATIVSFLPSFWLLVPGALGLVGVASLLGGDSTGLATLVTTSATMVAIALGVLVGLAITRRL